VNCKLVMTIYLKPFGKVPGRWWGLGMVAQSKHWKWHTIFLLQFMFHFHLFLDSFSHTYFEGTMTRAVSNENYNWPSHVPSAHTRSTLPPSQPSLQITMAMSWIDNNFHLMSVYASSIVRLTSTRPSQWIVYVLSS
jgi:hypothetical protein